MEAISSLRTLLDRVPERLMKLSADAIDKKPSPANWSAKEELGHLIDSAANNHQRIVRAQLEDKPAMPGYDQTGWVKVHGYHGREWKELIELWWALNRQLLAAAEAVPAAGWTRTLTIAGSEPVTLQFVFEDYLAHMMHHLRHIGIAVDDIKLKTPNAA